MERHKSPHSYLYKTWTIIFQSAVSYFPESALRNKINTIRHRKYQNRHIVVYMREKYYKKKVLRNFHSCT